MSTRTFATVMGVAFLLIGIMGFIPPLLTHPAGQEGHGAMRVTAFDGYLLGLFHVNILHSIVHVLFGVMGLAMSRTLGSARGYFRIVAVSYLLLTVMGLVPAFNMKNTFGLVPIHGNDVWLHALIAIASAYFGWAPVRETGAAPMHDTAVTH